MRKLSKQYLPVLFILVLATLGYFLVPEIFKTDRERYEDLLAQELKVFNGKTNENGRIPKNFRPDLAFALEKIKTADPKLAYPTTELLWPILEKINKPGTYKDLPGKNMNWISRGPTNVGGRTRTMAFDPKDVSNNIAFAGGVTGGLWKNSNMSDPANSWEQVLSISENLTVNQIVFDSLNKSTIYIGTGEVYTGSGLGAGIFVSTNNGQSFTQLASTSKFYYINDLEARVENGATVLYAAVDFRNYNGNQNVVTPGLYRSTNNGTTWTQLLPNVPGTFHPYAAADVEFDKNGTIWVGTRNYYQDNLGGGTILKSSNKGVSWTTSYSYFGNLPGRVELDVSQSNPQVAYAVIEDSPRAEEVIKTTNGGTSWTATAYPDGSFTGLPFDDFTRNQARYDLVVKINPVNANQVILGGIDLFNTTDGGGSWTQISQWYGGFDLPFVHADQHNMIFAPKQTNTAYFLNDGGIYKGTNIWTTTPTFTDNNTNYVTSQFYAGAIHPTAGSSEIMGGLQDNGTQYIFDSGLQPSEEAFGGDGAYCHISELDPNLKIVSYVYNYYYVLNFDKDGTYASYPLDDDLSSGSFINPTAYDAYSDRLYAAYGADGLRVYHNVSQESGNFKEEIFHDFGSIQSAIKVSPFEKNSFNTVLVGTAAGRLFKMDRSTDGDFFSEITGSNFPIGYLSSIEYGKTKNNIIVTFSNYGVNSVYYSTNGGGSWQVKEGNLPNMPVRWAMINPKNANEVILATELGVWGCSNFISGGSNVNWVPCSKGMNNVRCNMISLRAIDNELLVATYGRGLFTSNAFNLQTGVLAVDDIKIKSYPNPTSDLLYVDINDQSKLDYSIYNLAGQKLMENKYTRQQAIDVKHLPKGVYLISLSDGGKARYQTKFMKE